MILRGLIFLLVYQLFAVSGFSQDGAKMSNQRKLMLPGESHQFYVLIKSGNFVAQNDVSYCWFKNNSIHITQGGYDGYLIDGEYVVFYPNSDLKAKGEYRKGLKNGVWKSWYSNGALKEVCNWKKGKRDGDYVVYDSLGELSISGRYSNNLKDGIFSHYYEGVITIKETYRNGRIRPVKPLKIKKDTVDYEKLLPVKTDSIAEKDGWIKRSWLKVKSKLQRNKRTIGNEKAEGSRREKRKKKEKETKEVLEQKIPE